MENTTTPAASDPEPGLPRFISRSEMAPKRPVPNLSLCFMHNPPKIESFPRGYPSLSAFVSSDKDFTMFRCFSRLHARVLLHKQDELAQLEQRLDQLDQADFQTDAHRLFTNRHRSGDVERRALLSQIEARLKEYNTFLESYMAHLERPQPEDAEIISFRNWMRGNAPLMYEESFFLNDWSDLRRARRLEEKAGLEDFISRCLTSSKLGMNKLFSRTDTAPKSDDPYIKILNPARVTAVSRALTMILAVATLVVPIGVLYTVEPVPLRLGIIAAFTVVFSSLLCWLTTTRNYEIYSATAAYCAVMVVFVGSLPGS